MPESAAFTTNTTLFESLTIFLFTYFLPEKPVSPPTLTSSIVDGAFVSM